MTEKTIKVAIQEILSNSQEDIQNAALKQIKEAIISDIAWKMKSEIGDATSDFIKEIKPEIQEILKDNKDEVLKTIKQGIIDSLAVLGEKMVANAIKNVEYSYNSDSIISSLIKS